jgi:hypothetical protein
MRISRHSIAIAILMLLPAMHTLAQSKVRQRTLTVNGQRGEAMVYEIDGRLFVDLTSLAKIGHGTLSSSGSEIFLTIESATASPPVTDAVQQLPTTDATAQGALSNNFMTAAIQDLALIKDWKTTLAYAITKGVPGDGSRMVVPRDKAAESLRLANVAVSTEGDRRAIQLLTNHFNNVKDWQEHLVKGRKSMSTANYSMSEDALSRDPAFQKLAACSDFLGTMLPGGNFADNSACH